MTETLTGRVRAPARVFSRDDARRAANLSNAGVSHRQIGLIMGIPAGSVGSLIRNGEEFYSSERRATARERKVLGGKAGYAKHCASSGAIPRPAGVTAPVFTDEWYEQNHESFAAGMRAAYPGVREHFPENRFVSGGA